MPELPMGANTSLGSRQGEVVISHAQDPALDVNLTAFLVGADGRVRSDADMVFFNQPEAENGCASYHPPRVAGTAVEHRLGFDLSRLPGGIEKIVVALTEDRGPGFAAVRDLTARAGDIRLAPVPAFRTEKGLMVAEIYVRGGQHKVRAVWQGYSTGLHGLATAHGVEVDEEPVPKPKPEPKPEPKPKPKPKPAISMKKVTGKVTMKKGDKPVLMQKTALITASVSWNPGKDYDIFALVMTRDGTQVDVGAIKAKGVKPLLDYGNGAVKHLGDVRRNDSVTPTETLEIRLNPDIVAVVPVAYSTMANGTGSFKRYKVSLRIDNHSGATVDIPARSANTDDRIYTCVPGIIRNTPEGVVVEPLERYSAKGSERRPRLELLPNGEVRVDMDAGPRNKFKW